MSAGARIEIVAPLERAWSRARALLFRPFDVEKWLILGLASFLAGLADAGLAGGVGWSWRTPFGAHGWRDFPLVFGISHGTLDALSLVLLVPLLAFAVVLFLVLLWVGSRAKFVFLDGVLHDRAAIAAPWERFRRLGDSLFVWRAGFWLVCITALGALFAPLLFLLPRLDGRPTDWLVLPALGAGAAALLLAVAIACTWLLLESFVVPIMYAHSIGATAAWARLLPLLRAQPLEFLLYGLLVLLAGVGIGVLLVALIFASCCIVLPLLVVPYVSSVTLLPVSATFRLFGVEFLAQFGPQHFALPAADAPRSAEA